MFYLVILSTVQVPKNVNIVTNLHPSEFTVQAPEVDVSLLSPDYKVWTRNNISFWSLMKHYNKQQFEHYRSLMFRLVCRDHEWMKEAPLLCLCTGGTRHVSCAEPSGCTNPALIKESFNDALKCLYSIIIDSTMIGYYVGLPMLLNFSEILLLFHRV